MINDRKTSRDKGKVKLALENEVLRAVVLPNISLARDCLPPAPPSAPQRPQRTRLRSFGRFKGCLNSLQGVSLSLHMLTFVDSLPLPTGPIAGPREGTSSLFI